MRARLTSLGVAGVALIDSLRDGRLDLRAARTCAGLEREMADLGGEDARRVAVPEGSVLRVVPGADAGPGENPRGRGMRGQPGDGPSLGSRMPAWSAARRLCGYYAIQESLLDLYQDRVPAAGRGLEKTGTPEAIHLLARRGLLSRPSGKPLLRTPPGRLPGAAVSFDGHTSRVASSCRRHHSIMIDSLGRLLLCAGISSAAVLSTFQVPSTHDRASSTASAPARSSVSAKTILPCSR